MPASAARLSWHSSLMEKCTATGHIQNMEWRIPASLPISHTCSSGLFQSICHVFRCMRLFVLSQGAFHWALSAFAAVIWIPGLFPHTGIGRGSSSSSKGKKAQETLASRLACLFCFLLLPNLPVCSVAASRYLFVAEALTLESLSFSPLLSPNMAFCRLTANVCPEHASLLKLWVTWGLTLGSQKLKC